MSKIKMMTMNEMLMEENFEIIEGITDTGKKYKIETNKNKQGVDYYGVSTNIEIYGIAEEPTEEEIDSLLNELGYEREYFSDVPRMDIGDEDVSLPDCLYNSDLSYEFISYISYSYYCQGTKVIELTLRGGLPRTCEDMYWEDRASDSLEKAINQLKMNESKELELLELKWETLVNSKIDEFIESNNLAESDVKEIKNNHKFDKEDIDFIIFLHEQSTERYIFELADKLVYEVVNFGENPIDEQEIIAIIEEYIEEGLSNVIEDELENLNM